MSEMGYKIINFSENTSDRICGVTLWFNDDSYDFSISLSRYRPRADSWFTIKNILPDELEVFSRLLMKIHDYLENKQFCSCGGRRIFKKEKDRDDPELERIFYFKCELCGDEENLSLDRSFLFDREYKLRDKLKEHSSIMLLFYERITDTFKRYRYPVSIAIIMKKDEVPYIHFKGLGKVFLHKEVPKPEEERYGRYENRYYENSEWCLKPEDAPETNEILKTHEMYKALRNIYKEKYTCNKCGEVLTGLPLKPWYKIPEDYTGKCESCENQDVNNKLPEDYTEKCESYENQGVDNKLLKEFSYVFDFDERIVSCLYEFFKDEFRRIYLPFDWTEEDFEIAAIHQIFFYLSQYNIKFRKYI